MPETFVYLGSVNVPSGVLVLGMAGWIDCWRELGQPLSERVRAAASSGGGHLHEWLCEAIVVPAAADRPLEVRASTSPSPFDGQPTIATLEVGLGVPWPGTADRSVPLRLGDLPVDRYADDAHAQFGGARIPRYGGEGPHGWLDLPLAEAGTRAAELTAWRDRLHGNGLMVPIDKHTDFHRFRRAGWHHPLRAGAIEVGGCQVLGIGWDQGDHSMRYCGERDAGQVYPVTLEADTAGQTVMRWTVPPYDLDGEDE
ncbi:hypothetical protein OG196_04380 [Kitasatospora purpeofusca]|uniref:hypothetical protein n=1 Tax=Kitasatospora purpeofusca TaxID=67352 RepID=UPI002E10578A|nr:hypothetical protein OG715_03780 [Kitasatospora purpeofusca]WSR38380.1 hypothetical protein OG196_04380 [Kitasatospora purpeofusca]